MDVLDFLSAIDQPSLTTYGRAKAILWWAGREDKSVGASLDDICKAIENSGHPKQNASRLRIKISSDKTQIIRVPRTKDWRLHPNARRELDVEYARAAGAPKRILATDSIIPAVLFTGTRGYIEKIVLQINASYDGGLYDCCAVMCRRLLETLLVEIYEHAGRAASVTNGDGNFFMFADLLRVFENDGSFSISRNVKQGLKDLKKLGDLSAHNRRFNARREDIDRVRDGMRVSAEELLHLAGLA